MTRATVADVMASPAATIGPEAGLKEAAARLLAAASGLLAVVDGGGRVIGVLTEADLLVKAERPAPPAGARTYAARIERQRWFGTTAGDVMSRPVVAVRPDAGVADAARLMRRHGLRCLAVVDDAGRPVGTVSRGDLLRVFLRAAGEIRHDVEEGLAGEGLRDAALAVEDGVVTLNGEGDRARRAAGIAGRVDGVVAVRHRQGGSQVNAHAAGIEVLSEEECLALLRSHGVGRIAVVNQGQPLIFPVNYAADDRALVFRTAPGMKLDEAPMARVAFEIDEVDQTAGVAWSVLVQGVAYDITSTLDELSGRLREIVVQPMAPGEHPNWVAVKPREITGRRFQL